MHYIAVHSRTCTISDTVTVYSYARFPLLPFDALIGSLVPPLKELLKVLEHITCFLIQKDFKVEQVFFLKY